MEPKKIFRTTEGYCFETNEEAYTQSVEDAAYTVIGCLISNDKLRSDIVENKSGIKEAMRELSKALDGKLVTKYYKG